MSRGIANRSKAVKQKAPVVRLTLQSVAAAHAKASATVQKVEKQAEVWLEKAKIAFGKAESTLARHSNRAKSTPTSRDFVAQARIAKKAAGRAIKAAEAELKAAAGSTKKVLAAERKLVSAEAKLLATKAKHEVKMLAALAKLEAKLAKTALKGLGYFNHSKAKTKKA